MSKPDNDGLEFVLRWTPIILPVLVLGGAMVWFLERDISPPEFVASSLGVESERARTGSSQMNKAAAQGRDSVPDGTKVERSAEGILPLPGSLELESRLHQEGAEAGQDIELILEILKLYSTAYQGEFPLAPSNDVLISQLRGKNPVGVAVLSGKAKNISSQGELLDKWGVPYFFHPVSARIMEVRSAGPDRLMWTEDDIELSR